MRTRVLFRLLALVMLLSGVSMNASALDFEIDGLYYNVNEDGQTVTLSSVDYEYHSLYGDSIIVPSTVSHEGVSYEVTGIGQGAFYDLFVTYVSIPATIETIDRFAFYWLKAVKDLELPARLRSIGEYAFYGSDLTHAVIPDGVTEIPEYAFGVCEELQSVQVGNGVIVIGPQAFGGCSKLTELTLGDSVREIQNSAFAGCDIRQLSLPESLTTIETEAFFGNANLPSLRIGRAIESLEDNPFASCPALASIVVDPGNANYDSRGNCNAIIERATNKLITGCSSTVIPETVKSIGMYAFLGSGLHSIVIPQSITAIEGSAFSRCAELTSVTFTMPSYLTSVVYVFDNCDNLTCLNIVGQGACNGSNFSSLMPMITRLNLGAGITSIKGLMCDPTEIYSYSAEPPVCDESTFKSYGAALHVPQQAASAYFLADYWKNFNNIAFDANERLTLSQTTADMVQWEELNLTATLTGTQADIVWRSTNSAVAAVDGNGKVTAMSEGECDIVACVSTNEAVRALCHVTVSYPEIEVALSADTVLMHANDQITLVAQVTPDNTGLPLQWMSTNEQVATVSNGVVSAVSEGECDIVATVHGVSARCHVQVSGNVAISLGVDTVRMGLNEIYTFYPVATPDVELELTATTSDAAVAVVRVVERVDGRPATLSAAPVGTKMIQVLSVGDGTATITVTSADGMADPTTCVIIVRNPSTGDLNGDGEINVSDVTSLINLILGHLQSKLSTSQADVNGDGQLNVNDVTALINMILGKD